MGLSGLCAPLVRSPQSRLPESLSSWSLMEVQELLLLIPLTVKLSSSSAFKKKGLLNTALFFCRINGGKNKCVRQLGRSFLVISRLGGALWGVMHHCLMASKQKRCLLVCPHSCGWPEDGPGAAGELGAAWDVQSVFGFNSQRCYRSLGL